MPQRPRLDSWSRASIAARQEAEAEAGDLGGPLCRSGRRSEQGTVTPASRHDDVADHQHVGRIRRRLRQGRKRSRHVASAALTRITDWGALSRTPSRHERRPSGTPDRLTRRRVSTFPGSAHWTSAESSGRPAARDHTVTATRPCPVVSVADQQLVRLLSRGDQRLEPVRALADTAPHLAGTIGEFSGA